MNSFVLALRAIGTQLAMRLYVPAVIAGSIIAVLLIAAALWLTTLGDWWWLLFIPITIAACIAIGIASVALLLIRYVRPDQTKEQQRAVKQFVDKLQGVVDIAGTPKFIILFRVVQSIAAPSQSSYLSSVVKNRELASDFRELQRLFDGRVIK